jgi:IS605 OrfB family transposase
MRLSFKFKPQLNSLQANIIEELSYHTTNLYNIANYDNLNLGVKSYYKMNEIYTSNWHKEFLHSHNYQYCLKVLDQNWKCYFKSIADFKKNPSKYKGIPKPPKYKNLNDRKNEIIFTSAGIRFKNNTLILSLSKAMQLKYGVNSLNFEVSDKLQSLFDWNSLQQAKICWNSSLKEWSIILVYLKEEVILPSDFSNILAIDLGLSNLATMTFLNNEESYIINGKPLKSVNSHINKKIVHLQRISMHMVGSKKHKDTKEITRLRTYRENYVNNYMHKASKIVIELALKHKCETIVIGDIQGIKQNLDYNKTFVQIPMLKLKEMISYKAKLQGIEVILQNEAYTSGCSALDLEVISKLHYNKKRRICRGIFQSNNNFKINSDVNGSLNILRLHTKDTCIPKLIELSRDKGYVNSPIKQRVA